jgi:hypothetical protein
MKNLLRLFAIALVLSLAVVRPATGQFIPGQVLTAAQLNAALSAGTTLMGADPTGAADSTTVIQSAINLAVVAGKQLSVPPGTYKITSALVIPFGAGWAIRGFSLGGTIIQQATNNTPIFDFSANSGGTGDYSFSISDLTFSWVNLQPATATKAVGIFFENSAATFFDCRLDRLTFTRGYRGIAENPLNPPNVWGCSIRDIVGAGDMSGSTVNLSYGNTGQPNVSVDGAYIDGSSMVASEPLIAVSNNDSGWFNHIEANAVPHGNLILDLSGAGAIGAVKVEVATYGSGQFAFRFTNAHFAIGSLSFDTITVAAGAGAAYGIDANGGGGTTTLTIGQINATFNGPIVGTWYLVNSGAAPAYSVRFLSNPQGLLGQANAYLTQVPASVSADGVSVDDWQQPRLTGDTGDANTSWAIGSPNRVQYMTTLTANRVVALTDSYGNTSDTNLYNGVDVCVIRNAATPGAFSLSVNNGSGVTVGSIGSNLNGRICFMWKRSIGAWALTEYQTWTGNAP